MGFWDTLTKVSETADCAIDTLGHIERAKDMAEVAAGKTIKAKEYVEDAVALEKRLTESADKGEPPGTFGFFVEVGSFLSGRDRK